MTRDDLQRQAIRRLGDCHRLLAAARRATKPVREELARAAFEAAKDAQIAVEQFHRWKPVR